jgi:predicted DNA-binding transcriptional regulator AlpA
MPHSSLAESPAINPVAIPSQKECNQLLLDGYLRRNELAQQLGVSPRTIDRWQTLRCGPPRVAIGRTILYNLDSVRQWLRSKEESATSGTSRKRRRRSVPLI